MKKPLIHSPLAALPFLLMMLAVACNAPHSSGPMTGGVPIPADEPEPAAPAEEGEPAETAATPENLGQLSGDCNGLVQYELSWKSETAELPFALILAGYHENTNVGSPECKAQEKWYYNPTNLRGEHGASAVVLRAVGGLGWAKVDDKLQARYYAATGDRGKHLKFEPEGSRWVAGPTVESGFRLPSSHTPPCLVTWKRAAPLEPESDIVSWFVSESQKVAIRLRIKDKTLSGITWAGNSGSIKTKGGPDEDTSTIWGPTPPNKTELNFVEAYNETLVLSKMTTLPPELDRYAYFDL